MFNTPALQNGRVEMGFMSADGQTVQGTVAQRLLASGFDLNKLRQFNYNGNTYVMARNSDGKLEPQRLPSFNASTLRHEEWKDFDRTVVMTARQRLRLANDLVDAGLTYNLGNPFGTMELFWETSSDVGNATISKSARIRPPQDKALYNEHTLPIPIISFAFEVDIRSLEASRRLGNPINTSMAAHATRKVSEAVEQMVVNGQDPDGNTVAFGNKTVYGYTSEPNVNTVTLDEDWDASGKTGKEIVKDVTDMKQAAINANHHGPWWLYVPTAYETKLDQDYSDNKGNNTIRQRIMAIDGIEAVRVADYMTADTVTLVERNAEVNEMVVGFQPRMIEWSAYGGSEALMTQYAVLAIMVPRIRSDYSGQSGNVVLS
jgi:uncharacterized linocin/CFP29 family protein